MGAENSVLEGCLWGDAIDCPPKFPWQLSPVTKPDGTEATVFEPNIPDGKDSDLLKKCALILKTLRHPNIVRFIGYSESSDRVWLATESVVPLVTAVPEMSPEELCVGLCDILHGLDFLHSKLGMNHNNLCLSSIYVSPDGTWKLGGLEHACKFTDATQEYLEKCRAFRHEDSLSPEEKTGNVRIDGALGHARDIFAFGALVDSLLDLVKEKNDIIKTLDQQMSVCSSADPASRPKVTTLLGMTALKSDLLEILSYLKNIAIKSDTEKREFFSHLVERLRKIPETVLARRLVVPLLARFVLLNEWADKLVLPYLLRPKRDSTGTNSSAIQGLLDESLYKQYVINHLFNIFHVHDSHIRLVLLEHFSHYVQLFTRAQLEDDIFIQILLGVRDTDDRIVAASLRALADLVAVLGGDFVIGGSRKSFFFHGLPKKITAQDMVKMEIPQNMSSALSHHKPLLKDLAYGRTLPAGKDSLSVEKERRMKEKEQRREEAKLKREERKKKLKDKTKEVAEGEKQCIESLYIVKENLSTKSKKPESDSEKSEADPPEDKNGLIDVDDVQEKDSSEWSDWEDPERRISAEIEAELESMTSNTEGDAKLQTSPSPYRSQSPPSPPPMKIDWSDVPEADRMIDPWNPSKAAGKTNQNGPLTLFNKPRPTSGSEVKAEKNGDTAKADSEDWGSETWEVDVSSKTLTSPLPHTGLQQPVPSKGNSLKLTTTSTAVKAQVKKPDPKKVSDDLGMGLDIKSIEIKAKPLSPELDFFADMAPSISQSKSKDFLDLLEQESSRQALSATAPSVGGDTSGKEILNGKISEKDSDAKKNNTLFAVMPATED
ncbi:unnamed protein product, partial [Lymnaea stagnalis]